MNYRYLSKLLGIVLIMLSLPMALSLPWAFPAFGRAREFESEGFYGLCGSMAIALSVSSLLLFLGRKAQGRLLTREAMATVGLSWVCASLLGSLPFLLSGVKRDESHRMTVIDALFESVSGLTCTGASVLTDIENPELIPACILFWRSELHLLGGLGIMVLFVAVLGHGSAGKALMRSESVGPWREAASGRMQHAAWTFAGLFLTLTLVVALGLKLLGMDWYDSLAHAFGTIATGGFGLRNTSIEAYNDWRIELWIGVFLLLSGINYGLLYLSLIGQPRKLLQDVEFRAFAGIVIVSILLCAFAMFRSQDYLDIASYNTLSDDQKSQYSSIGRFVVCLRHSFFQVASVITNTGFVSCDFDRWNDTSRGMLLVLAYVGSCAGSTSSSIKVIRYVLLFKLLKQQFTRSFRPNIVQPLRVGGETIDDPEVGRGVMTYFTLALTVSLIAWLLLITIEPESTWTNSSAPTKSRIVDCASGVAACFNGVGPGLGVVGAMQNYAAFSAPSKVIFMLLMLMGRLEIYAFVVLMMPSFWRTR
jgi:trk system potassium uptake protein TrkH